MKLYFPGCLQNPEGENRNDRLFLKATYPSAAQVYLGLVVEGASGIVILELLFLTSSFTHLEQQQTAGLHNQPGDTFSGLIDMKSSSF